MTTKRRILVDALDEWREAGALDEPTHARLRGALDGAPPSPDLDDALARGTLASNGASGEAADKRGFAADAMQFIGGLLLGAAIIALVVFLEVSDDVVPWTLVGAGSAIVAAALLAAGRGLRSTLVDAALAAGLVPLVVGGFQSIGGGLTGSDPVAATVLPILATLLTGAIAPLRSGKGPGTFLGVLGFALMSWAAVFRGDNGFFSDPDPLPRFLWLGVLLVYGALLLLWRGRTWVNASLGMYVAPLALAFANMLDLWDLTSVTNEILMGVYLGALLAAGIVLGSRGLVAGAAAGLTIDAVVFAFDVGGAGTAVLVLLALGGLLVWQAELVRGFFRRRSA